MSDGAESNCLLREKLVRTAVQFLQNPKVVASPLQHKKDFLKRKGLTDSEVEEACRLANIDGNPSQNVFAKESEMPLLPFTKNHAFQRNRYEPTWLERIKEFFNATALIGATFYCSYWLYKKFIKPLLFGPDKKDSVTDSISELDKTLQSSIKEVKESISKVECDVQKLAIFQATGPSVPELVQELKQDLASLKALLLSRKQFPRAPASIPSWQLGATSQAQEKAPEAEDDAGSGSSTNNSDSSLEMIREDPPKE